MAAMTNLATQVTGIASPILVAAIATWAGGPEGWRWAWYTLGIPVSIVAIAVFFIKEPPRGQFEKEDVLGEVIEDADPAPISMEAAFARLKKIATIRSSIAAFCALGFGLFSVGSLSTLYLNDTLHATHVLQRGFILSLSGVAALPFLPFVGGYFDRVYRKNPARALALVGALIVPSAIFTPLQFSTHSKVMFVVLGMPQAVFTACAFAMVAPVLQAVVPYRLRGMGTALATMYIFFVGGFLGGIIADFLTNGIGVRGAVILLNVPTSIIGGLLLMNGARFIRNDLSLVVEELLEEQEEHRKRFELGEAPPALQVANVDFSYGPVQVLFDVNFEIARRVRRAPRHQRRRQVDDPAHHQRPRGSRARRRAARRAQHHLRRAGVAREARHRAASRRQGRVPEPHRRAEPGGERAARGRFAARDRRTHRQGARAVPRARRPPAPARAQPQRRSAADARARACSSTVPRCCSSTSCRSGSRRSSCSGCSSSSTA